MKKEGKIAMNDNDKNKADFKEDFEYLDWIKAHPDHEKKEDVVKNGESPRAIFLDEKRAIFLDEEEVKKLTKQLDLHSVEKWIEKL